MKIIVSYTKASKPYYDDDSPCKTEVITNTGSESVQFGSGEPEDMSLTRDLSDAFNIVDLCKLAYEAGKRGEDIEIINKEYDY